MPKRKRDASQPRSSLATAAKDLAESTAINVTRFAEARSAELQELVTTLQAYTGNSRVFQTVPRHLRRRAASHNIRRLPVRLRLRAERERVHDRERNSEPRAPESRRKRRRKLTRADDLAYRAQAHKWLETHVWHAKRMKMADLFGYRVAEHPNDRSARVNMKAMRDTALAHDASYYAVIELRGALDDLARVLALVVDPLAMPVAAKRFLTGTRFGSTLVCTPKSAKRRQLIAPVTFLWRARETDDDGPHQLWVWVHPAAALETLRALLDASDMCELTDEQVDLTLHERNLLKFSLIGPRAHAILCNVLAVVPDSPTAATWRTLTALRSPASLPLDTVLTLTVHDPRLDFPRKMPKRATTITAEAEAQLQHLLLHWPADGSLARSTLWDKAVRERLLSAKIPEHKLNERRRARHFPGQPLSPTPADAKVPILLMRRRALESSPRGGSVRDLGSGWDIVMPAGWGRDFWKALVFAGARVGGQREMRALNLELGRPSYPHDFPGTNAYRKLQLAAAKERQQTFLARPPAKRPPFAKLALATSPFSLDPTPLLAPVSTPWQPPVKAPAATPAAASVQPGGTPRRPPLLLINPAAAADEDDATAAASLVPLATSAAALRAPVPAVFVLVSIVMTGGGVPVQGAQIYRREGPVQAQVGRRPPAHHRRPKTREEVAQPLPSSSAPGPAQLPPVQDVVGLVTSGGYSTMRGHGFGVGVCAAQRLLAGADADMSRPLAIVVRNPTSFASRPATATVLSVLH